jgi:D-lactate dehydrogenase (cytochrome)
LIHAQRLPEVRPPEIIRDPEILAPYLEDASASAPGNATGVVRVADEAEAASLLRQTAAAGMRLLFQAARSSLTGGATPRGEVVVSVEQMRDRGPVQGGAVTVQPGMRLDELQQSLREEGLYFPPVPTYQQAMVGGAVSTNAGGAASFKYGVTRQWVRGLRVLLFNGDLLVLERGQHVATRGQSFRIGLSDGRELSVPVPDYRLPAMKKISAGYFSSDPLDLVDLFVGAEGTLGLISAVTLSVVPCPASVIAGWVFLEDPQLALLLAAALRDAARKAREGDDRNGPDVRSIEWLDGPSLDLLRGAGEDRRRRLRIPSEANAALLFEMELPTAVGNDGVEAALAAHMEQRQTEDGPLTRIFKILEDHRVLETLELAFPDDDRRRESLSALREAVPTRVNEILTDRRRDEPRIEKVGGDLIVPFDELTAMIEFYREGFANRGLEFATWGHLSDGNLHPNALPRNGGEVERAHSAQLEFAAEAARRGGCPLSEHGVGRSRLKQEILRRFLGPAAIAGMREIKAALDPDARLAQGVILPA